MEDKGIAGSVDDLNDDDISSVINELVHDYEERARGFQAVALRNEKLLHGEHMSGYVSGESHGPIHIDLEGRRPRNYMRKLWLTYSARLTEELPFAKAFPNENSGFDIASAKVANAFLGSTMARLEWARIIFDAALTAQAHGLVYFKTTWDPDAGEIGIDGEPAGEVHVELGDIFNVAIDDVDDPHAAEWCVFRREIDRYEAQDIYDEFDVDDQPSLEDLKTAHGENRQGFMLSELWYIPSPRFPEGLFALQVGGKVVYSSAFPYDHGGRPQIPVSCWRIQSIRGVGFGDTHVNDAVPLQIAVNEHSKAIADLTREVGNVRILAHNKVASQLRRSNHVIKTNDLQIVQQGARYLDPPKPPEILFGQLDELITALHDLFGQNELLLGRRVGDQSGKSLAYLNRLDGLAMAGSLNNLNAANQRTARQMLMLAQQYIEVPRLIGIEGANAEEGEVVMFTGADIAGATDVRIEPASGNEHLSSGGSDEAMQQMQAGIIAPHEGLERQETGLDSTQGELVQRQMVRSQIEAALMGNEVEADSTLDPMIALDEIGERVALEMERGTNDAAIQSLMSLASKYQSVMARMQSPQPEIDPEGGAPSAGTQAEQDLPGVTSQF